MKISYNYKKYEDSKAATEWSLIGGMLPAIGIFIIIGFTVLGANLFGPIGGFIGFVFGIAFVVFGTLFCKYIERRTAVKAVLKKQLGRNPSKEELSAAFSKKTQ